MLLAYAAQRSASVAGGADNCIDAAGILFFTFIGMEAPAVGAEEARNPARLPAAIVGNAGVALLVYFFMALSLLMMVPAAEVGTPAVPVSAAEYRANAFTAAFSAAGEGSWGSLHVWCVPVQQQLELPATPNSWSLDTLLGMFPWQAWATGTALC